MKQLQENKRSSIQLSNQDLDQFQPVSLNSKKKHFSKKHCRILYAILFAVFAALIYLLIKVQNCQEKQQTQPTDKNPQIITVLQKFQHDSNCYTQGLSFLNQTHILQSCGLYKHSYLQILQYNTAKFPNTITQVYKSDFSQSSIFAQGSVLFPKNQLIYLLSWREHQVNRFQRKNDELVHKDTLNWMYEGWGLTHDNQNLIISDGTHNLFITDQNLNLIKTIPVRDSEGKPINYLNELQYVQMPGGKKYIYANIFLSKKIVKIDYLKQKVQKIYDLSDIVALQTHLKSDQVLNGIAFDKKSSIFVLTGKKWQKFYLLKGL